MGSVGIVHPVLQQMQRNAEGHTKFLVKPKFAEAKEVFTDVLGEISTNKLFTAIIERSDAICTSVAI